MFVFGIPTLRASRSEFQLVREGATQVLRRLLAAASLVCCDGEARSSASEENPAATKETISIPTDNRMALMAEAA